MRKQNEGAGARRLALLATLILAASAWPSSTFAQGHESARALALGSSVVARPTGLDAVYWNPAAVNLSRSPQGFRLDLVGLRTRVVNNSFTVDDYNRFTGADLTDEDKEYILSRVPESGLRLDAVADLAAMSFAAGPVAVSISSQAIAEGDISKDALELLLFGNAAFDTVNLSGTGGESFVTAGIGFTFARPIAEVAGSNLYCGTTLRYVKGIYGQKIIESYGQIITADAGVNSEARLLARTANNGTGIAADVGLLYDYGRGWTFGASITNLIGSVRWEGHPEEHLFTFSVDSLSVMNAGQSDLVQSHDSTYATEPFSTRLPATLRLGVSRTSAKAGWTAQWEQGLNDVAGAYTVPRLSSGLEWWIVPVLPLRAGLSMGGERGVAVSGGSGLHAGFFYMDLGVGFGSGLYFGAAKGAHLAFNTGLKF